MGGSGTSSSGGSSPVDMTEKVTLGEKSTAQKELESKLLGLNLQQVAALRGAIQRIKSGAATTLQPEDRTQVQLAFDHARDTYNQNSADMTRFLTGGRGTALFNTPISQQAMSRLGFGLGDIQSAEAGANLNYALKANDARAQLLASLGQANPGAGLAGLGFMQADRFGNRTSRSYGTGSTSSSSYGMLPNQNLDLGFRLAGAVGNMANIGSQIYKNWPASTSSTGTATDATGAGTFNIA